jgi:hypothetical protein
MCGGGHGNVGLVTMVSKIRDCVLLMNCYELMNNSTRLSELLNIWWTQNVHKLNHKTRDTLTIDEISQNY